MSTCHSSCPGGMLLGLVQEALPLLGPAYPPQQREQVSQGSVVTGLLLHQLLQLTQRICVLLLHAIRDMETATVIGVWVWVRGGGRGGREVGYVGKGGMGKRGGGDGKQGGEGEYTATKKASG